MFEPEFQFTTSTSESLGSALEKGPLPAERAL
jgi:hypothetical protein